MTIDTLAIRTAMSHLVGSPRFRSRDFLISGPAPDGRGQTVVLNMRTGIYLQLDNDSTHLLERMAEKAVGSNATEPANLGEGMSADSPEQIGALVELLYQKTGSVEPHRQLSRELARNEWREFQRLSRGAKITVAEAFLLIACIEVALRILPIDVTARLVGVPLSAGTAPTNPAGVEVDDGDLSGRERFRRAGVEWALAHWIFEATCLRRALAIGWFLRKRRPRLHIGRFDEGDVLAHAWLSFAGTTVGAVDGVRDFARLDELAQG